MPFADKLSYPQNDKSSKSADFGFAWGCVPWHAVSAQNAFLDEMRLVWTVDGPAPVSRPRLLLRGGRRMLRMCRP
jgi:hypothetical protein